MGEQRPLGVSRGAGGVNNYGRFIVVYFHGACFFITVNGGKGGILNGYFADGYVIFNLGQVPEFLYDTLKV